MDIHKAKINNIYSIGINEELIVTFYKYRKVFRQLKIGFLEDEENNCMITGTDENGVDVIFIKGTNNIEQDFQLILFKSLEYFTKLIEEGAQ